MKYQFSQHSSIQIKVQSKVANVGLYLKMLMQLSTTLDQDKNVHLFYHVFIVLYIDYCL